MIVISRAKLRCRFYSKNPISVDDVDIDTILVPKKVAFSKNGFKYFIGYKNNNY